jgi:hypothetical protein
VRQIISIYSTKFGCCIANEIGGQVVWEMLLKPIESAYMHMELQRRPTITESLSILITKSKGYSIERVAIVKPSSYRPLGFIPTECSECECNLDQDPNGSEVIFSCGICGGEGLKMEIRAL